LKGIWSEKSPIKPPLLQINLAIPHIRIHLKLNIGIKMWLTAIVVWAKSNCFTYIWPKNICLKHNQHSLGRLWFFVRLKDKRYYISESYDSTKMDELIFIYKMLKAQKQMIIDLVK